MKSDIVSIIVPVYNGEKYISRCLDSLINQTYINLEIVLVNDGSIDKSKDILNEYAKTDNRIKIYNQINQGASVARNTGLEKANGKYIMFVDADDYIDSHMVEEMIKNIKHENTIVFCDNTEIWSKNIDERKLFNEQLEKELNKEIVLSEVASGRAGLVCGKLFDKSIVDKNNIKFDKNIKMCEDQLFFLEIINYCDYFIHIPKSLYHYDRRNENSVTIKYQERVLENQLYVLENIERILLKSNLPKMNINLLIKNRYVDAVQFCINNEISNTKLFNISNKIKQIKNIISNDKLYKAIMEIPVTNLRIKIIKFGFKKSSAIAIYSSFFILDRCISPIRRNLKNLIKR